MAPKPSAEAQGVPLSEAQAQTSRFHALNLNSNRVDARDVSLAVAGHTILDGAHLVLEPDLVYGLIGRNGAGKSTLLAHLKDHTLVPAHLSVLLVAQAEDAGSEASAVDAVLGAHTALQRLVQREDALRDALASGSPDLPGLAVALIRLEDAEDAVAAAETRVSKTTGARGKAARQELVQLEGAAAAAAEEVDAAASGGATATAREDSHAEAECLLASVREALEELGGLEAATARAKDILIGLGFTHDSMRRPTAELSGGWRARTVLARALFMAPDVLLLDEPTNHLDMRAAVWLERWISEERRPGCIVVVVSHDRQLLDGCVTDILLLQHQQLSVHHGDYSTYAEAAAERALCHSRRVEAADRAKDSLKSSIQHMKRAAASSGDDKRLKQVAAKRKKLEERSGLEVNAQGHRFKLNRDRPGYHLSVREELNAEVAPPPVTFTLPSAEPLGYRGPGVLQAEAVDVGWGGSAPPVLRGVTLDIPLGSRIGLCGPNGAGKSTLLALLAGRLDPVSGELKRHATLRVALFYQGLLSDHTDGDLTPLQLLADAAPTRREQDVWAHLGRFDAGSGLARRPLSTLSGGQQVRVALALATWPTPPHVLLLDEPTNHLDIESVEALSQALLPERFSGAVVVASHDRAFLADTCTQFLYADPEQKQLLLSHDVRW